MAIRTDMKIFGAFVHHVTKKFKPPHNIIQERDERMVKLDDKLL